MEQFTMQSKELFWWAEFNLATVAKGHVPHKEKLPFSAWNAHTQAGLMVGPVDSRNASVGVHSTNPNPADLLFKSSTNTGLKDLALHLFVMPK